MASAAAAEYLPIIQLAITPVILLSGTGALMLTLTNRMGRVVDRTRALAGQVRSASGVEHDQLEEQLGILWRRTKLVRAAVTCAALSMLLSCLLVVAILIDALAGGRFAVAMIALFAASIGLLIASLVAFLRDIFVSLHALRLEVGRAKGRQAGG